MRSKTDIVYILLILILSTLVSAESATKKKTSVHAGVYVLNLPNEAGGVLTVTGATDNSLKFDLECTRGAPSHNTGVIEGAIKIKDEKAVFKTTEFGKCEIKFRFAGNTVDISQDGSDIDCGFGYGVYCDGKYKLQSRK